MGFMIGCAQVWYQVLAISGGEQFDRSKPLLRQAEKRVGFKVQSDIQDIETFQVLRRSRSEWFKVQSDIQDIETDEQDAGRIYWGRSKCSPIFRT